MLSLYPNVRYIARDLICGNGKCSMTLTPMLRNIDPMLSIPTQFPIISSKSVPQDAVLSYRKLPNPFSMTNRTGRRALLALYPNADRGIKFCDVSIATLMALGAGPSSSDCPCPEVSLDVGSVER